MERARLQRIRRLFEAARALPADERAAFLARQCGDDHALHAEVASLLTADRAADGGVLDRLGRRIGSVAALLDEPVPQRVGPYEIRGEAGRGAMGVVYRAHDPRLQRDVALKFLPRVLGEHAAARARFVAEARAASALDHAGICTIHDIGATDDGRPYIAMAWYDGGTLADRLRAGPLPVANAIRVAGDVADALECAHAAGIVHRDIKPANIAFGAAGETKVLDFGVAALEADAAAGVAGTPRYMAPEQLRGDTVDRRADVWAVGAVLYEMLTGRTPFDGEGRAGVLAAIERTPVPALPRTGIPAALGAVVRRALAPDPASRYPRAADLGRALRQVGARPSLHELLGRPIVAAGLVGMLLVPALLLMRARARPPVDVAIDAAAVAILPFRVSGDSSLAYLREGMVDLLAATLTGEGGLRAADPRTVYGAGGRPRDDTAVAPDSARAIARRIGAGNVLLGDVVGSAERVMIHATMLDLRGRVVARARTEGAPATLTTLVDAMAAQLLSARAGEAPQRMAALTTTSLPALRAFLDAQTAYRGGRYDEAMRQYRRALALDTTFALAGLGLELAGGWIGGAEPLRALGRNVAWLHRGRLSAADQALLAAAVGPAFPQRSTVRQTMAAIEDGLRLAPDRVELWYMLGDALLHHGRVMDVADREARAEAAFRRALALDSTFTPPMHHLILLQAHGRRRAQLDSLAATQIARAPAGATADFVRWLQVAVRGHDAGAPALDAVPTEALAWIAMIAQDDGIGMASGHRAARAWAARAATDQERFEAILALHALALNAGRPHEALVLTDRVREVQPDPTFYLRLRVLDALYAGGDSAAAALAAAELAVHARAAQDAAATHIVAAEPQRMTRCVLEQWRATHGARAAGRAGATDDTDAADAVGMHAASVDDDADASAAVVVCEAAARALRAVSSGGAPAATRAIAHFDSLLVAGPFDLPLGDGSIEYANSALARVLERAGEPRRALDAIARRVYYLGWQASMAASLADEARLARALGDTTRALRALTHYLALRSDPEPAAVAEVEALRRQRALLQRP